MFPGCGNFDIDIKFLEQGRFEKHACVSWIFQDTHPMVMDLWLTRPAIPAQLRFSGFGQASQNKATAHDQVNPLLMVHFIWNFLCPRDRLVLHAVHSSWSKYAELRADAVVKSLAALHQDRPKEIPAQLS